MDNRVNPTPSQRKQVLAAPGTGEGPNIAPCAECGASHPVPRRRFLHYVGLASAGVTGLLGGLVRYKPSAAATNATTTTLCDDTSRQITCGPDYTSCIGRCTDNDFSCCRHCTSKIIDCYKCCNADNFSRPIRVVVYRTKTGCYTCCRYCGK